jgi:hypothetical protein
VSDEPEPNALSGSPPPPSPGPTGTAHEPSFSPDRAGVVVGGVLIALGVIFFAEQALDIELGRFGWPLFVIVPGVLLMAASVTVGGREGSGLAVAGAITTVVGVILAVQNATGLWATWAYTWALVGPGGTGIGLIFYGIFKGQSGLISTGVRSLGTGLALFAVFGLFFEGVIGLSGEPFLVGSDVLPFGLIGLGVILVGWSFFGSRQRA